ncbi:MAG: enoyl-CoA hydratase/isomerase family protein [Polyangiales bacterium]
MNEQPVREYVLRGRGPNMMTQESIDEFAAFLAANPESPILLYGEGDAFSTGHDLDVFHDNTPEEITRASSEALDALFYHRAPTVAAINGHAVAGGCILAQACDVRLCTDDPKIRLGVPGVALGLTYPPKLERVLRYRLPPHTVDRVLLEAAQHDPVRALRLGLIDEIVPDAIEAGRNLIRRLAGYSPQAYVEAKLFLRSGKLDVTAEEAEHHAKLFAAQCAAGVDRTKRD